VATTTFIAGREKLVAGLLPIVTLVTCMFAGGGRGGAVLKVKVTVRPFVPCGAEDGVMLEI
jgi:hypothetical protein